MIEENLKKIGLSPSETKIYIHLLRNGSSYANKISRETGINRTNVYEALDRLVERGIVSFVSKNKVKNFQAEKGGKVIDMISQEENKLKVIKDKIEEELQSIQPAIERELEASIFVGKKGLKMLLEEIIEAGKPICLIASKLQFKELFGHYFELWHKKREMKKIMQKTIFPLNLKDSVKKRKYLKYKFVEDKFTNPTTTIIYGENCLFIQWSEEPIAIKIKNLEIVKTHKNYFEMIWNS